MSYSSGQSSGADDVEFDSVSMMIESTDAQAPAVLKSILKTMQLQQAQQHAEKMAMFDMMNRLHVEKQEMKAHMRNMAAQQTKTNSTLHDLKESVKIEHKNEVRCLRRDINQQRNELYEEREQHRADIEAFREIIEKLEIEKEVVTQELNQQKNDRLDERRQHLEEKNAMQQELQAKRMQRRRSVMSLRQRHNEKSCTVPHVGFRRAMRASAGAAMGSMIAGPVGAAMGATYGLYSVSGNESSINFIFKSS